MGENYSIKLCDVEKTFKVYLDKGSMLKERVISFHRNRYENRQVLRGINFTVQAGEAIGLIGRNGCGKSTTLKLLTKILKPNKGTVEVKGRVSSLIELGAGFHPDMSGRENIYINATIFGLKKEEIDQRVEEIIEFSELAEFIDNPVRTYSSGMYMRLAFSVAINVNADVLLIDEILAVGDVSFQKKCFDKLMQIKEQGTTIVIVSHDMAQMYRICDRLIWIEKGKVVEEGIPKMVGTHYLDSMEDERIAKLGAESKELFQDERRKTLLELTENVHPEARREGTGEVRLTKVSVVDKDGKECRVFNTGDKLVLECEYKVNVEEVDVNLNMDFVREDWLYCYGSCCVKAGENLVHVKGTGKYRFNIEKLMLLPGKYYLDLGINGPRGEEFDYIRNIVQITVRDYVHDEFGPCTFEHSWELFNQ